MATNITPIKTSSKLTRKLSIAVGLLSFAAFIIQGLGSTYGFQPVAEQLTQTCLLFAGAVNIFFLGDTTRKNIDDKESKDEDD